MTISNDHDNDQISQQPDWASAPAHDPNQPVGAPTEHVYTDRGQRPADEPGWDAADTRPERGATAAESLNGTVGSERGAERHAAADTAIGVEQAAAPEAATAVPAAATDPAVRSNQGVPDSLFDGDLSGLRSRWNDVQAAFVDDPRDCVKQADGLVSDVVDQLTANFSQARTRLEEQWDRGEEASTEDLRIALQGYRQFFERLLAV